MRSAGRPLGRRAHARRPHAARRRAPARARERAAADPALARRAAGGDRARRSTISCGARRTSADDAAALDALAPAYLRCSRASAAAAIRRATASLSFDEFTAIYPVGTSPPTPRGAGARSRSTRPRVGARSPPTSAASPPTTSRSTTPTATRRGCRTCTSATTMHNSIHTPWWKMGPEDAKFLPAGVAASHPRQPRRQTVLAPLAALARPDVARLHPPEYRPHRRAPPDPAGRERPPLRGRRLPRALGALRRLRHRRRPDARGDGRPLLHRLLADRREAGSPAGEKRAPRLLRLALRRRPRVGRRPRRLSRRPRRRASSAATPAKAGATPGCALREADYQPETVQFYRLVDIPFARELRQVGVHDPATVLFDRRASAADRGQKASVQVLRATLETDAPSRPTKRRRGQ